MCGGPSAQLERVGDGDLVESLFAVAHRCLAPRREPTPRRTLLAQLAAAPRPLLEVPEADRRRIAGSFGNWMLSYSTTCRRIAPGSTEVETAAGQDLDAAASSAAVTLSQVIDDEPEVALLVGRLRRPFGESDELVADVEERHPRDAASQLVLEDLAVELQRLLEVADLERDVVDTDQASPTHVLN